MDLEDEILRLQTFITSRTCDSQREAFKKFEQHVKQNMTYIRGICLIAMYANDKTHFFNSPTPAQLFSSIHGEIKPALTAFSPMFLQAVSSYITTSFKTPNDFADLVDKFFRNDLSYFQLFAYSTFPACYGYFTGKEFLEAGSSFLIALFSISHNIALCSELLSSFFYCSPIFYDHLWSSISHQFSQFPDSPDYNFDLSSDNEADKKLFFFNRSYCVLIESLKTALPHLSQYHIDVLKAFQKAFEENSKFLNIFCSKIISERFRTAADGNSSLISTKHNEEFNLFLDNLDLPENTMCLNYVFNFFVSQKEFLDSYPRLTGEMWSGGIPSIFCNRDLYILHQMLTFLDQDQNHPKSLLSTPARNQKFKLEGSFNPYFLNLFPVTHKDKDKIQLWNDLFARDQPETLDITLYKDYGKFAPKSVETETIDESEEDSVEEFERIWKTIYMKYGDKCTEIFLYKQKQSKFRTYCLKEILKILWEYLLAIGGVIKTFEKTSQLKLAYMSIISELQSEAHRCFEPKYKTLTGIEASLKWITDMKKTIPDWFPFEATCAGFDSLKISLTSSGKNVDQMFNSMISQNYHIFIDDIVKDKDGKEEELINNKFKGRKRQVDEACELLEHLDSSRYGKKLKRFVELIKRLNLLSEIIDVKVSDLLFYVIYNSKCSSSLTSFLFINHFIFNGMSLAQEWNDEVKTSWSQDFAQTMWSLITDEMLREKCADAVECLTFYDVC